MPKSKRNKVGTLAATKLCNPASDLLGHISAA